VLVIIPIWQFAFYLAKAAIIIQAKTNPHDTLTFFDTCFEKQPEILNTPTANVTPTEVRKVVASWATTGTTLTAEQFEEGWEDDKLEMETR